MEFDQLPFEPAAVVVFVLPLLAVVFAWEKADAVMDEKNIAPIIVTDKINPILKLVFLLLINITTSCVNIAAFKYAVCIIKVKILLMTHGLVLCRVSILVDLWPISKLSFYR